MGETLPISKADAGGDYTGLLAAANGFGGLDDIDEIMLRFEAEARLDRG